MVTPVSDFFTSRSAQSGAENGPALDCSIWSVAASMHCCTVTARPWPSIAVLTSHKPALRAGASAASACAAKSKPKAMFIKDMANQLFLLGFIGLLRDLSAWEVL